MKKFAAFIIIVALIVGGIFYFTGEKSGSAVVTTDTEKLNNAKLEFVTDTGAKIKTKIPKLVVENRDISGYGYTVFLGENLEIMAEEEFLEDVIGCSINAYPNGEIKLLRKDKEIIYDKSLDIVKIDGEERKLPCYIKNVNGKFFLPVGEILGELGFSAVYRYTDDALCFTKESDEDYLPAMYDMRKEGRLTGVRDQGEYGTCWAFASLGALESTMKPMYNMTFSPDHMVCHNSFDIDMYQGGENSISLAYLAAWQGPVYERDDPYDGVSNRKLSAVKHLEEAIVIDGLDIPVIKGAIYKYGGVETQMYMDMSYLDEESDYYNAEKYAYYFSQVKKPNHEVVIIGWDDNFSKDNFATKPEADGAFICKNSWGPQFGETGYFYVSYYDKSICSQSVVYTRVGEANNYDKIYQSDLLGWVGRIGFGEETAYFANVYTAGENEELAAVSFYATDVDTEFSVYLVPEFTGPDSLSKRVYLTGGVMRYAGYYTVDMLETVPLKANTKFAVVIQIYTPGSEKPVAVEFDSGGITSTFDISDGEGYLSLYGEGWHSVEESQECNLCLKAFTIVK